jgi:hypothetical protein
VGQAIGGSLALAIGVALSPLPIIAVVLMLTSRRARANGPLFVLGWLAGLGVVGAIVLSIAGPAGASSPGSPATWVSWVKVALGLLLLLVAVRQFRAVGAAASIAQTGISGGEQAIAYLVFALVGTLGVGIPVGIYFALGPRADKPLAGLKDWMGAHNAAIMSVLCLVIGIKLIGGLTA